VTSAAASIRLCDKFLKDIDLFLGALTSKRIVCLPLPMGREAQRDVGRRR
jgi:hypothetical protein